MREDLHVTEPANLQVSGEEPQRRLLVHPDFIVPPSFLPHWPLVSAQQHHPATFQTSPPPLTTPPPEQVPLLIIFASATGSLSAFMKSLHLV